MTKTISEVVRSSDEANELLRRWCDISAQNGGWFEITEHFAPGSCWFTRYEIFWPEGVKEPK